MFQSVVEQRFSRMGSGWPRGPPFWSILGSNLGVYPVNTGILPVYSGIWTIRRGSPIHLSDMPSRTLSDTHIWGLVMTQVDACLTLGHFLHLTSFGPLPEHLRSWIRHPSATLRIRWGVGLWRIRALRWFMDANTVFVRCVTLLLCSVRVREHPFWTPQIHGYPEITCFGYFGYLGVPRI